MWPPARYQRRSSTHRSPLGVGPPPDRRELTHQLKSGPAVAGSRKEEEEEFFAQAFFVDHTSGKTEACTPAQRARVGSSTPDKALPAWLPFLSPLRTLSLSMEGFMPAAAAERCSEAASGIEYLDATSSLWWLAACHVAVLAA